MKLSFAALAVTALIAAAPSALAQIASKNPAAVKAGTYKVDPYHTQVVFTLSHFGFTEFSGMFGDASGSLVLNTAKPAADKLDVTIGMKSVMTTVPALTTELNNNQWFDTAKYPTTTFTSTKVIRTGKTTATIDGNLTLHGVTRPIVLKARFIGTGINPIDKADTVGFSAIGVVKRSEFGVKAYVPMVGDDVTLTLAGAFELQK
ncbi:MAG: polyisoprenoid-binding protein [Acidiphilium sp. 37-64-53]|uniref:YceI family protein n=1 Tax=Acidiphilium TaxID=522 RepID=UPI000BDC12BC|nr:MULTISPECIES: YceI family protein [Acidiphilium]OYW01582.1 MAG: polyisoprenoid-binding protein [Acidiphilium sp. 37-64-53]OZB23745.1 MAG: polyisoprenoid-binding protein [Acidiphilium sp. 34-64-41]HQT85769.1 YceI family protein [Acidiphilium rubrum]